jgi:hypothetical protein
MVDIDTIKKILSYDKESGEFYWATPRPKIRVGQKAGYTGGKGYRYIEINARQYAAHRLAWAYVNGYWPKDQIDHINRNKSDNRISNLREATNGQNRANSKTSNKHGLKGVKELKWMKNNRYQAQITFNKKVIYLGCFKTPEEAHKRYCEEAKKLHGDFANHALAQGGS